MKRDDEKTKKSHSRMAWSQEKNADSQQSETTYNIPNMKVAKNFTNVS
jgi:hypothetical protein